MIEKKESIKSSFIFQSLYQIIILVIPLIISPYLTRILGSESLGIYTYVNSIASYFICKSWHCKVWTKGYFFKC